MRRCINAFTLCLALLIPAPLFAQPAPSYSLLQLNASTKAFLDEKLKHIKNQEARTIALHKLLFTADGLNIGYSFKHTKTAQETFDTREGNCVSLSNLYVAAARYLGLKAQFNKVDIARDWDKLEQFYVLPHHMNVVVKLPHGDRATVELVSTYLFNISQGHLITDEQAHAEYYSNVGVEALAAKDYTKALEHLQQAVTTYPKLTAGWTNLGVAYKHTQQLAQAEHAYLTALQLAPQDMTSIRNLYMLYKEQGEHQKLAHFSKKVEKYISSNPYAMAATATLYFKNNQLEEAKNLYQKAIKLKPTESEFHTGLAKTYFFLGELDQAHTSQQQALNNAPNADGLARYQAKLNAIEKRQKERQAHSHEAT